MSREAMRHLSECDPRFSGLISRVGRPRLGVERDRSPYEALVRAIAHQQLHGNAARAILARFEALFPAGAFPTPEAVLSMPEETLRGCGFSATKVASIRDICLHAANGTIPTRRGSVRLSDEALIERLTVIRGVGRWTVEMLLIFTLAVPTFCRSTISACGRVTRFCSAWMSNPSRAPWRNSASPGRRSVPSRPGICIVRLKRRAARGRRAEHEENFGSLGVSWTFMTGYGRLPSR